jgi:CRP/FNR family cyclic AMP-dependent transcriptional regulator
MLKRFEADEFLFREGDPSQFAILIHSGSADVLRQVGEDSIVLGTVKAGEWVGEMGLLEDRARSATVRAASRVEAELVERQAFLDRVSDEPELARKLLVRMSARLRDVEDMLTSLYAAQGGGAPGRGELVEAAPSPSAPPSALPSITLAATTRGAQLVIGSEPIAITRLPFTVGREPDEGEAAAPITPDLLIPDPAPYRLSRAHFSLIERGGEIVVRDLASTLGTIVNDRPLGRDFPIDTAPLHPGENTIVAGGKGSPFVFAAVIG